MKLEHTVRYEAPVAEVYAMLTDPAFREKAAWAQDAVSVDASVTGGEVTVEMEQRNTDIPSFAKAFAGETTLAVTTEQWRDGTTADFRVETPGKPTTISGVRRLVAEGEATLDVFTGEAKAKVPLIGGKIEKIIASKLEQGRETDGVVGAAWLAGER